MTTQTPTRKSKIISLEEAAGIVKDGTMLGLGGNHNNDAPCAFARELVRRKVKNLTVVPSNASGYQSDILIGAGCVKTIYLSYIGFDYLGAAPNFRRQAETGTLNVIEFDEMGLMRGLKAASAGVAFFPLPDGMRAVDVVRANPEFFKEIDDPFTGKKVVVVPPIRCDIAVIHVAKCDPYGNAREAGYVDVLHHQAANKVIVTTDEIVTLEDTQANYRDVTIVGKFVDAVVKVPYGAHPGQCIGCYQQDEDHQRQYLKAAKDDSSFKEYLEEYVYKAENHEGYLEKVGIANLLKLKYF